jgi:hypothetical protein
MPLLCVAGGGPWQRETCTAAPAEAALPTADFLDIDTQRQHKEIGIRNLTAKQNLTKQQIEIR